MTCPKCGSDNVMPTYIKGKYKCLECGTVFVSPKTSSSKEAGITAAFLEKEQ